jgi:hypothetical protein
VSREPELAGRTVVVIGGSSGIGFAIEDFQPLHVKRAIENGRRTVFDI